MFVKSVIDRGDPNMSDDNGETPKQVIGGVCNITFAFQTTANL